jgi:class 3 adenylate cyclase
VDDVKNTDALAVRHVEKKCELLEIRQAILKSSKQVAVVFIDLVGSTNLKQKSDDETWLISIYEFIGLIAGLARETRGTLVERLGDGALITFEDVLSATTFIDAVARDSKMGVFPCKIAADFGKVYYFKFEDHLKDDPYGPVVDRCARLLELACPGLPLFGERFAAASLSKDEFHVALEFPLKGFPRPEKIMIRSPIASQQARAYLEPLLAVVNDKKIRRSGYRYVARVFSIKDFSSLPREARPFLLRELINIPKLPYSYSEFSTRLRELSNDEDIYDFYGALVEWECLF